MISYIFNLPENKAKNKSNKQIMQNNNPWSI